MPDFIHLACPTCGGQLKQVERYVCGSCGNEYIPNQIGGGAPRPQQGPQVQIPTKVPPKPQSQQIPISVTLLHKGFHKANYRAGEAGDMIELTFRFQSLLDRDIRAFKGQAVFKDLFDELILTVNLTHENGLPKMGTADWQGGIQFNQFQESHQRLLSVDSNDMTVAFVCESIIYTDGTRELFT